VATFDVQIDAMDNFFSPRVVQISVGETVRWMNLGGHNHTSTSDDGIWDSGTLMPGQFFDFTFNNEGVFDYTCLFHSLTMFGTVVVGRPDSVVMDINMANMLFDPDEASVIMGQYVRWINFDDMIHTTTDTTMDYWDSGDMDPGDVFILHAEMPGEYYYICVPHADMGMAGLLSVIDTTTTPGCEYVPGDVNGNGTANGLDVSYFVNYLKGGAAPPDHCDCPPHGHIYAAADANGNCAVNGLDVSYMVNFFKGGAPIMHCMDCMPAR
jgi:plastocyanin